MSKNDSQTIQRQPRSEIKSFTFVDNRIINNRGVSWESRMVLIYILSKPDNWRVNITDLQQECGRDKVRRIIKELIANGYMEPRKRSRNPETGQWSYTPYLVYDLPLTENPSTGKPSTEKPSTENTSILVSTEEESTESLSTNKDTTTTPPEPIAKESTPDTPQPKERSSSSNSNDSVQQEPSTYALIMRELSDFREGITDITRELIDDEIKSYGEERVYAAILHAQANGTESLKVALKKNLHRADDVITNTQADTLLALFKQDRYMIPVTELKRYSAWGVEAQAAGLTPDDLKELYDYVERQAKQGGWSIQWTAQAMINRIAEFRSHQQKRADAIARQQAQAEQIDAEPETAEPDIDPAYWPDDVPMPGTPEWDAYIETQAEVSDEYL